MVVRVEFYGIPRSRTGVAHTALEFTATPITLAHVVKELAARFPDFGADCVESDSLARTCVANINGERFVGVAGATINDGETVLIMSADAGG
jgi:molybdopterin converting factor small subunit